VNPVFELIGAPTGRIHVSLGGQPIAEKNFAWDGHVLWLDTTIESPTEMVVTFHDQEATTKP
jgi:hypothetical protein